MIDAGYNGPRLVALYDEDNAGSGHRFYAGLIGDAPLRRR